MEKDIRLINEIDGIMRKHLVTEERFNEWMCKKHPLLNDKTPNEMIENGEERTLREFIRDCLDV